PSCLSPFSVLPPTGLTASNWDVPPGASRSGRGYYRESTRERKGKIQSLGGLPRGGTTGRGYTPRGLPLAAAPLERRHHVACEPGELLLELLRPHALRPVDHHLVEARVLLLEVANAFDHVLGRAAEPRLLVHAVAGAGN